jgi:putative transposase
MIERDIELSVSKQCDLLGLARASFYRPRRAGEKERDVPLMNVIDRIYTECPFYGSRKITASLKRRGLVVNRKRIQRLMRRMGIYGQAPGPMTSRLHPAHQKYPYLLRGLAIERPNQVWSTDITYVPLPNGSAYLVAVIDHYSRRVLSWELSNTLDGEFCARTLKRALAEHGVPEIFNTDQGCQFTSEQFTGILKAAGVQISMDGKGRCLDNIFIERFWRNVKYEDIYLKDYQGMAELYEGLKKYFEFYNERRVHEALGYQTPLEVYQRKAAA